MGVGRLPRVSDRRGRRESLGVRETPNRRGPRDRIPPVEVKGGTCDDLRDLP